jgi:hypothetical protein
MIGITARSLLLAVFWLGASCPLAASQLSAAKRLTAQQFGYDHTWHGPGTQGRPDQLLRRGPRRSGSGAALIQQRIRHVYRRQRSTPLPSRTAKSRHQSQLGVEGVEVAHAGLDGLASAHGEIFASHRIGLPGNCGVKHRGLKHRAAPLMGVNAFKSN